MEFCPTCGSSLTRKNKCICNANDNLKSNEIISSNKILNSSFPFEKEKYYEQGFIRNICNVHPQWGISFNKIDNSWIVIKNKKSNSNTYYDRMDKDGLYHYTGQGLSGDQTMTGNNYGLKNATSNKQKIHLFWQDNQNSNHKYVGEVKIKRIDEEQQPGQDKCLRNVFVFLLRPVD